MVTNLGIKQGYFSGPLKLRSKQQSSQLDEVQPEDNKFGRTFCFQMVETLA